jgi:predicted benzoate:H+ symporter BenE
MVNSFAMMHAGLVTGPHSSPIHRARYRSRENAAVAAAIFGIFSAGAGTR